MNEYITKVREIFPDAICIYTLACSAIDNEEYKILADFYCYEVPGRGDTKENAWRNAYYNINERYKNLL